jgi:Cu+-exporting ATPase
VLVGTVSFLKSNGVAAAPAADGVQAIRVEVAIRGKWAGSIELTDPIKPGAREAVADLKRSGLMLILLTGDREETARAVAAEVGISEVRAGVRPEMKAQTLFEYMWKVGVSAMVGDGINDAEALTTAHVGIAMGTGADVAIESADVVLPGGDIAGVVRARKLGLATLSNIRQNLMFAFGYNLIGVPFAAGLFSPWIGWSPGPMIASAAMSLSSVSVIANALRLRRIRL